MKKIIYVFLFLISQALWACPPCPSGSNTAGTGVATNLAGCKCNDGTYTWSGSVCNAPATGCNASLTSWLTDCRATPTAGANGSVQTAVANTASGFNGSATFTCNSGTWNTSSETCSAVSGGACPGSHNCTWDTDSAHIPGGFCNIGPGPTGSNSSVNPTGCQQICSGDGACGTGGEFNCVYDCTSCPGGTAWDGTSCAVVVAPCTAPEIDNCNRASCPDGGPCSPVPYSPGTVDACGCTSGVASKIKCSAGGTVVTFSHTYSGGCP
jgi:hypothetical protein